LALLLPKQIQQRYFTRKKRLIYINFPFSGSDLRKTESEITLWRSIKTKNSYSSFNVKIKAFRSQFRGVRNMELFVFRLTNIYA
jgi:hypothetical protein